MITRRKIILATPALLLSGKADATPIVGYSRFTGFTPAQLTDLAVWYEYNLLTGSNGSEVLLSPDQSGHGRNGTANTTNSPTLATSVLNGMNVVNFPGGGAGFGKVFTLPSLAALSTSGTIFNVLKANADPGAGESGPQFIGTSGSANHWPFSDGNIYNGDMSNARKTVGNPTVSLATWVISGIQSANNDYEVWLNGTSFFTTATNTVGFSTTPIVGGGAGAAWIGQMAEWILISPGLTPGGTNWQKVEGYLACKWGLQSVLPGGHPYKVACPT